MPGEALCRRCEFLTSEMSESAHIGATGGDAVEVSDMKVFWEGSVSADAFPVFAYVHSTEVVTEGFAWVGYFGNSVDFGPGFGGDVFPSFCFYIFKFK